MLRNGQDRSLRMWKSSGRILSEYTKRVLRRADGEHWPLATTNGARVVVYGNSLQQRVIRTLGRRDLSDRKSTRLNSSHIEESRMPSSA